AGQAVPVLAGTGDRDPGAGEVPVAERLGQAFGGVLARDQLGAQAVVLEAPSGLRTDGTEAAVAEGARVAAELEEHVEEDLHRVGGSEDDQMRVAQPVDRIPYPRAEPHRSDLHARDVENT